jgi:twitching motility protein PilJ
MSYQQAERAYIQGNYDEAAQLVDALAASQPEDPRVRLLRGHIYCYGLQRYDAALNDYEAVSHLTTEPSFLDYAVQGIETCRQYVGAPAAEGGVATLQRTEPRAEADSFDAASFDAASFDNLLIDSGDGAGKDNSWGSSFAAEPTVMEMPGADEDPELNPFGMGLDLGLDLEDDAMDSAADWARDGAEPNPFGFAEPIEPSMPRTAPRSSTPMPTADSPFASQSVSQSASAPKASQQASQQASQPKPSAMASSAMTALDIEFDSPTFNDPKLGSPGADFGDLDFGDVDFGAALVDEPDFGIPLSGAQAQASPPVQPAAKRPVINPDDFGDNTLFMSPVEDDDLIDFSSDFSSDFAPSSGQPTFDTPTAQSMNPIADFTMPTGNGPANGSANGSANGNGFGANNFGADADWGGTESLEFEDSAAGQNAMPTSRGSVDFLDEFDEFDDFGGLSDFDLSSEDSVGFSSPVSGFGNSLEVTGLSHDDMMSFEGTPESESGGAVWSSESLPSFAQSAMSDLEPTVAVEQGILAPFENAQMGTKRMIVAGVAGIAAMVGVAGGSVIAQKMSPPSESSGGATQAALLMTLAGGIGGFAGALAISEVYRRQIKRTTEDMQAQFSKISQGNFNAQATIYSEDEFGQLAANFNQMSRVILTTTKEAQRKAEEQEQQKEDLQRQVIRLLDDVEGAARGDLTVQAEVTADVLGAVADSFNLTIQNLREIVLQVKTAATQVNRAFGENETFARSLSSDALRQAEELAVTLNSVQVMTDSIQRVADSAREAEEVARTASVTALKGGEAVDKTVAGILEIRETVAETTRKVKRLAESSQEISKAVALISAIASRTNLLALNASIEAARAGEAGRGFAIVAEEVRQLADRAAKSSKDIEQIVMQIQGETSEVMKAMEEGTQQVIEGTKLAQKAKRSLDDIIQVSNRIDQLVRSITSDTVEQTETSRQVAQVMQSVELTAQETSQEAQRVARSLQNLAGVARDLQTSVERFRVEDAD